MEAWGSRATLKYLPLRLHEKLTEAREETTQDNAFIAAGARTVWVNLQGCGGGSYMG